MRKPEQFARHPMTYQQARDSGMFRGWCDHVVDGDTFDVLLDLGIGQYSYDTIRLYDLDTPEINSGDAADRARGQLAQQRTIELVMERHVLVRTYRDAQTFGRYVAETWFYNDALGKLLVSTAPAATWVSLADTLRAEGHVKIVG